MLCGRIFYDPFVRILGCEGEELQDAARGITAAEHAVGGQRWDLGSLVARVNGSRGYGSEPCGEFIARDSLIVGILI